MNTDLTSLLTTTNATLAAATFAICATLKGFFKTFFSRPIGQRILPILPLIFAVGLSLLGACSATRWQDRLITGLIAGFAAGHVFKVGRTSMMGWGIDLPGTLAGPSTPAPAPTPDPTPAPDPAPATAPTPPATTGGSDGVS